MFREERRGYEELALGVKAVRLKGVFVAGAEEGASEGGVG